MKNHTVSLKKVIFLKNSHFLLYNLYMPEEANSIFNYIMTILNINNIHPIGKVHMMRKKRHILKIFIKFSHHRVHNLIVIQIQTIIAKVISNKQILQKIMINVQYLLSPIYQVVYHIISVQCIANKMNQIAKLSFQCTLIHLQDYDFQDRFCGMKVFIIL